MNSMMLKLNKMKLLLLSVLLLLFLWVSPFSSLQAFELSGAFTFPPGGIVNALYLSGTPVEGGTIKVKTESDMEYTLFLGSGFGLASIEKIDIIGGGGIFGVLGADVYSILGVSLPLALNAGAGLYLLKGNEWGIRLQYTTLITVGGTILGTDGAGPYFIGWTALLLSYKF